MNCLQRRAANEGAMVNAFVEWAVRYIEEIDQRLPFLEDRRITTSEMRNGIRTDTTQQQVDELKRQKAELYDLIARHNAARAD
ncbi:MULTISPECIES: hypothetical protein [Sphingomonadales]|uniref:hypothetical protein n=2 Tax=Alphaproteobacteria TaxID=28211 RepID=UPI0012E346F6|nr:MULTISPECIES: hypothetical protein [Sphingomonadales]